MTNENILKAIRSCAKKLKRNPELRELRQFAGVTEGVLYRRFGNLKKALTAAGLKVSGSGFLITPSELLLDWATVVRKLRHLPSGSEYRRAGRFCVLTFYGRFKSWVAVSQAFRQFAQREGIERRWNDVLRIIATQPNRQRIADKGPRRSNPFLRVDRPVYGNPLLLLPGMAHAPVNEAGVMYAFGALAPRLGFVVKRWQTQFPDCVALREMAKGQWQDQNVELEMHSRNFVAHKHDAKRCDVIVCWVHDWAECPEWIEVIELKKVVEEMGKREVG